jgi:hypothetical protein
MVGDVIDQDCWQCERVTQQTITATDDLDRPSVSECNACAAENELL